MLLRRLISFFLFLFTTLAFANEDLLIRYEQRNQLMPSSGKYAGEFIENDEKRTLIFLTQTEKEIFKIDTQTLAFANFRHNGEFYIATIPAIKVDKNQNIIRGTKVVEKVSFMKEHWAAKSRPETKSVEVHSELIFEFKKSSGIQLVFNQDKREVVTGDRKIHDAVLSIEAIRSQKNKDADFLPDGLGYNFAVGYRFYSTAERDLKNQQEDAAEYTSYELDFRDTKSYHPDLAPMDNLLFTSLKTSFTHGRNQTYNLIMNNCTNRLFDLMDTSVGYNVSKGGKVDFEAIGNEYIDFVNNDLKSLSSFIFGLAEQNLFIMPPEAESQIYVASRTLMLENLSEMENSNGSRDNVRNYLYGLPPFIEGQLKARGLIK